MMIPAKSTCIVTLGGVLFFLTKILQHTMPKRAWTSQEKLITNMAKQNVSGFCLFHSHFLGNFPGALDFGLKELALAELLKDTALLAEANFVLFTWYWSQEIIKQLLIMPTRQNYFQDLQKQIRYSGPGYSA